MLPKDSLLNLSLSRKRQQVFGGAISPKRRKSLLPMEQLKQFAATRKNNALPGKKSVGFNFTLNRVYYRHLTEEDLSRAWMSTEESNVIKKNILNIAELYRNGHNLNLNDEYLRGVEIHINPVLKMKKITKSRNFINVILQQQRMLYAMRGSTTTTRDDMLSSMSQLLSQDGRKEALQLAAFDAMQARIEYQQQQQPSEVYGIDQSQVPDTAVLSTFVKPKLLPRQVSL